MPFLHSQPLSFRLRPGVLPALALGLAALCGAMPGLARADEVVLFRCTDVNGALTIQNAPCPAGSTQRIQRFAAAATGTPPPAVAAGSGDATSAVPAAPTGPAPSPASSSLPVPAAPSTMLQSSPLPVLQGGVQTSVEAEGNEILDSDVLRQQAREKAAAAEADNAAPKAPLPEIYACINRDGNGYLHEREPAPPHCVLMTVTGLGGNTPVNAAGCEVVRDTCQATPEAQRCNRWQQRFRDARGSERFATPENQAAATAERERLQAILAASECPVPG
ncbi:hypothetical protein [Stenotrophomonas sp.]|uniref:hypothetical protein n=1 Tax=Stenotrophomonas sp. TaxID=69392 RepID=UPI002FCAE261